MTLPLSSTLTLGEAAKEDPRITDAITRCLGQAHISRVQYDTPAPGAVRIQMSLDPAAVWQELSR